MLPSWRPPAIELLLRVSLQPVAAYGACALRSAYEISPLLASRRIARRCRPCARQVVEAALSRTAVNANLATSRLHCRVLMLRRTPSASSRRYRNIAEEGARFVFTDIFAASASFLLRSVHVVDTRSTFAVPNQRSTRSGIRP